MPNVVDDRRRALDGLAAQLKTKVIDVVNAAWTSQVSGAAKSVTDVWPDTLTADQTKLQQAFAAYRPQVEVEPPITPRDAAVKAVTDAADQYGKDLAATSSALVGAKTYKSDSEKSTIDAARDAMDKAAVALTGWKGDFLRFDASVVAQPVPPPTPTPPTPPTPTPPTRPAIETYATIMNNNTYPITIAAKIASESDWGSTSNRPDKTLPRTIVAPFQTVTGRADLAGDATKAVVWIDVTVGGTPEVQFYFDFDQALATTIVRYLPVGVVGVDPKYVIFANSQTNSSGKPELIVVVTEDRGT